MQGYAAAYARQAMAYIGQIIGYKAQWEEDGKRYMEKRNPGGYMFSNADLRRLIFPLIVEQILAVSVGMVDTMMVSSVGEAATSGVSLVDMVNTLFINIFAAVATGGAVVSSQYLGQKRQDRACQSADQLLIITGILSLAIMAVCIVFRREFLSLLYRGVAEDVMRNARTYLVISAVSYPFLSVYNSCAALFRSMGNSKVSMMTSFVMNMINIIGNAICVFGLKMGVAGVAWPTLISRVTAAFMMFVLIQNRNNTIRLNSWKFLIPDRHMIKNILSIGIPNGLENGMFQFGKIFLQSLVSSLGTVSIASFAVASNLVTVLYLPGNAIGLGLVTIVGQCVGAGRLKEAKSDTKSLIMVVYGILAVFSTAMVIWSGPLVGIYHLSPQAALMARELILIHSIAMVIWPLAFTIPHALRASLDAKFTMAVSVFSMWVFRIGFAYLFVYIFDLGLSGVWYGMFIDWIFRALMFSGRFKGFERRAGVVE